MLLRSSSTPILKTYIPQSSPAVDSGHRIPSIPISLTSSPINKIQRASSDGNMRQIVISNRQKLPTSSMGSPNTVKEEIFTFPTLSLLGDVDDGGDDNGGGGGGGVDRFGDWGQGKQRLDEYYRKMIKTYPGETLLLTNYAKFLKEVQGNFLKAEEYCGKAIIVKPDDGEILSLYGDLIWINHGDEALAQSYFDRAVKASPNNCYVLASYARYLWAAEKDDD
ncbi:hypothetical protein Golax_015829 [Gossypium laxum]|uniref:Uncharacterized protein n=2 Tax=Gossypium TaxID=3633 RepID=A0A7J8WH73_GOSAI|nr:hypothetical protein [Gossypium aridum]MBA0703510.1 hypothetical protein [Gossypium laxum]